MIVQEEIRRLSLPEKLALMESVWSELSNNPEQVEVPQWHKDILDARDASLQRGEAKVLEWEEAREQIARMIR